MITCATTKKSTGRKPVIAAPNALMRGASRMRIGTAASKVNTTRAAIHRAMLMKYGANPAPYVPVLLS